MADKFFNNQNVYVEADYDNIVVVDPNKMVEPDGKVVERLVNHEELVIYANLEAKVLPRTKLALGSSYDDTVQNLRIGAIDGDIASKVNFMKPKGKKYFDTSWTEQLTGDGSLVGEGINQTKTSWSENSIDTGDGETETQYIQKRTTINQQDTQLLGIDRISIKLNTSYVPVVNIEMTDIQGRMLFEQGENSPYSAFMQMPYPLFTLTIKGYFGKAIRYELMLRHFNARFDASDGNYKISTQYIARTYALLSDIQVESLFTLPRMYITNTTITDETNKTIQGTENTLQPLSALGIGGSNETVRKITNRSSIGRNKISEVYDVYKSKGLIDDDFPDISLNEMLNKLNKFEQYILDTYGKEDMSVLSDISKYRALIKEYRRKILGPYTDNWENKYIDTGRTLILDDARNTVVYRFKSDLDPQQKSDAITELEKIVNEYNDKLNRNTTFGSKGSCIIGGKRLDTAINCNINYKTIIRQIDSIDDVNIEKSYRRNKGNASPTELQLKTYKMQLETEFMKEEVKLDVNTLEVKENTLNKTGFAFGNESKATEIFNNTFLGKLSKVEEKFENDKKNLVEETLSNELAEKIKSADDGLGFNPTIKNVLAVICASSDAFFRLMDKVHEEAWEQRKNPARLSTVIDPTAAFGSEGKDSIESVTSDGVLINEAIVYPWPQYLELKKDKKGNEEYVNVYPGDSSVASKTKAYDSTIWPEVKFVEEYIRATLEKESQLSEDTDTRNELRNIKYIFTSAVEYPFHNNIYNNLSEVSFFYEIFERTEMSSFINKLNKGNDYGNEIYSVIADMEFLNVNESVKKSPSLTKTLKNFSFSYDNIQNLLFNASKLGSWNKFERDYYITPYIKNLMENPNTVYNEKEYNDGIDITGSVETIDKLKELLKSTKTNQKSFVDGYPFDSNTWLSKNIKTGNTDELRKTNNTIGVLDSKKVIASFKDEDEQYSKKFINNFSWITNTGNIVFDGQSTDNDINSFSGGLNFFNTRDLKDYYLTESKLKYSDDYSGAFSQEQTTSLLNTPYFVNALLNGVEKEKNGDQDGYTAMGYLYLNSLPLSNVSERMKTHISGLTNDEDYIFAVISKFSAIHKQPFLWFLKNGAIWHRYKNYHENGIDILDDVWKDFDFTNSFDPLGEDMGKTYTVRNYEGDQQTIQGTYSDTMSLQTHSNGDSQTVTVDATFTNVGFYPKVIENMYYYFTEVSIFNSYSELEFDNAYYNKKLQIRKNTNNFLFKGIGHDIQNPSKTITQNSWYTYFDIANNTDFYQYNTDKILIVPSIGDLKFNQVEFECFRGEIEDIENNSSVHNGSVRCLWSAPNYGYFNNSYIKKPEVNQYLKNVKIDTDNSQPFDLNDGEYGNIEDLINLLGKDLLDQLEKMFLNFCKKPGLPDSHEIDVLDDNKVTNDFTLYDVMKSLFIVTDPFSAENEETFLKKMAKQQMDSFVTTHNNKFFNKDMILKMGNPSHYNKRVFNSFSNDVNINPVDKIEFGSHVVGTVPGNGVTLNTSITNSPEVWKEIYLNFGDSEIENIKYTDDGSIITDFFYDFDIEFTVENVKRLSPIIRMYTSKKLDNNNYTPEQFQTDLNSHIEESNNFHRDVMNHLFIKLNNQLPNVEVTFEDIVMSNVDGADITKIDIWETFRLANDKWVSGQDFKERTIFEDFLFLDRANRPVGDKVVINIDKLRKLLKNRDDDMTVYQLVSEIMTKNHFTFMPTPVYTNFYGRNDRVKEGEPIPQDIPNDLFGTFMEVDTKDSRPRMLGIYIGKPSENAKLNKNHNSRRLDDAFDLTRASECPLIENTTNKTNYSDSNKCVGFNVDFGIRNQGIFKNMSIDMSQHKNIAPSFQVLADMGSMASQRKVAQQSQSLYNFYKSQSYNCTVESMGNAMIQPTMYFNLRHVPMFTGPYLIINVSHDITSREFTTQFEGIRIPKYALDVPDKLVMSVNRELLTSIQERLKNERINNSSGGDITDEHLERRATEASEEQCQDSNNYPNIEFIKPITTSTTKKQVNDYLGLQGINDNLHMYLFVLAYMGMDDGVSKSFNYNIYDISTENDRYVTQNNISLLNGQCCVLRVTGVNKPMASFRNHEDAIEFMIRKYNGTLSTILNDLVEAEYANGQQTPSKWANAMAKFWANTSGRVEGNNYVDINVNVSQKLITDNNFKAQYDLVSDRFLEGINKSL